MSIINGYQSPKFTVITPAGVNEIPLVLTNSEGLVEKYEIKKKEHELLNYSIASKIDGFKIIWTLNYDEFAESDTMLRVKQILEYAKAGYDLWLTPRTDHPWRSFNVYVSMDDFEMGIRRGGAMAKAHRLVVLEFATVNIEPDLKWYSNDFIPHFTHVCNESIKFVI